MSTHGREIRLASRPTGWPTLANFDLTEVDLADPGPGEVLVRNLMMSVDPYMRGRMNDAKSYVPPFQVGKALSGAAIGTVLAAGDGAAHRPGDTVLHDYGWRDFALAPAERFTPVDPAAAPGGLSAYLGVLGVTGLTAYVGLLDIAAMRPGDVVFVSGAAGAVGSVAAQLAALRGAARVVGSAGSAAKVAYLTGKLGLDAAFDYHDGPVRDQLRQAAPEGIDVYFDNVGGEHLEAAIAALRPHGRVALCGAIAGYNDAEPVPGPRNLALAIGKRLSLRGFIVTDHLNQAAAMRAELGPWLADGRLRADETFVDGLEQAPAALLGVLRGENTGKMVVRLPG